MNNNIPISIMAPPMLKAMQPIFATNPPIFINIPAPIRVAATTFLY